MKRQGRNCGFAVLRARGRGCVLPVARFSLFPVSMSPIHFLYYCTFTDYTRYLPMVLLLSRQTSHQLRDVYGHETV